MTSNLLILFFFVVFFLFLAESIFFLKKKGDTGSIGITSQEGSQTGSKYIFIGGLVIVLLVIAGAYLFLSKQKTQPTNIVSNPNSAAIPTQPALSPRPNEIAYVLPTEILPSPSPTSGLIVTVTKAPILTKTPSLTVTPSPTKVPPTPTNPPVGGPGVGSDTTTPATAPSATSAVVVIPKLPVAGSIQQTATIVFLAVSSVMAGLIL